MYELMTIFDSAKSFYKKAFVKIEYKNDTKIIILYSYNTEVLRLQKNNNKLVIEYVNIYSKTTLRHIKEVIKQELQNNIFLSSKMIFEGATFEL